MRLIFSTKSSHHLHQKPSHLVDSLLFALLLFIQQILLTREMTVNLNSRGLHSSHLRSIVACITYVCSMRSNDVITKAMVRHTKVYIFLFIIFHFVCVSRSLETMFHRISESFFSFLLFFLIICYFCSKYVNEYVLSGNNQKRIKYEEIQMFCWEF